MALGYTQWFCVTLPRQGEVLCPSTGCVKLFESSKYTDQFGGQLSDTSGRSDFGREILHGCISERAKQKSVVETSTNLILSIAL